MHFCVFPLNCCCHIEKKYVYLSILYSPSCSPLFRCCFISPSGFFFFVFLCVPPPPLFSFYPLLLLLLQPHMDGVILFSLLSFSFSFSFCLSVTFTVFVFVIRSFPFLQPYFSLHIPISSGQSHSFPLRLCPLRFLWPAEKHLASRQSKH